MHAKLLGKLGHDAAELNRSSRSATPEPGLSPPRLNGQTCSKYATIARGVFDSEPCMLTSRSSRSWPALGPMINVATPQVGGWSRSARMQYKHALHVRLLLRIAHDRLSITSDRSTTLYLGTPITMIAIGGSLPRDRRVIGRKRRSPWRQCCRARYELLSSRLPLTSLRRRHGKFELGQQTSIPPAS